MKTVKSMIISPKTEVSILSPSENSYLNAATANNTRRAYQGDIDHYEAWGGLLPATPEMIIVYLNHFAQELNPRTLSRRLVAIKQWHVYQGYHDPTQSLLVKKTLKGIYHVHGKPENKAPALTLEQLTQMVSYLKTQQSLSAYRDSALLQVGFFGAFRRSELVSIHTESLHFSSQGLHILIPRSKTDPTGQGQRCAIPYGNAKLCPVKALQEWLKQSGITKGPIFRRINRWDQLNAQALNAVSVNRMLVNRAEQCGLSNALQFSSHSLRRGLATAASQQGASLKAVMRQGRWKHVDTVLGYIDEGCAFEDNAAHLLLKKESHS